jgi:hypothetical protein
MSRTKLLIIDIDFLYKQLDPHFIARKNINSKDTASHLITHVLDLATIAQPLQVIFLGNEKSNLNPIFNSWCMEVTTNIFNVESSAIKDIIFTLSSDEYQKNFVYNPNRPQIKKDKIIEQNINIVPNKLSPRVIGYSEPKNVYSALIFPTTELITKHAEYELYSNEDFFVQYSIQPQYWIDLQCLLICQIATQPQSQKFLNEVGSIYRVYEYFGEENSSFTQFEPFASKLKTMSKSSEKLAKLLIENKQAIEHYYTILKPKLLTKFSLTHDLDFLNGNKILMLNNLKQLTKKSSSLSGNPASTQESLI